MCYSALATLSMVVFMVAVLIEVSIVFAWVSSFKGIQNFKLCCILLSK